MGQKKEDQRPWGWWITGNEAQLQKDRTTGLVYQGGQLEFSGGSRAGRKRKKPPKKSDGKLFDMFCNI